MASIIDTKNLSPGNLKNFTEDDRNWIYNGLDCCVTLELRDKIKPLLGASKKTYDFSLALQAPVLEMMMTGLLVDKKTKTKTLQSYNERIEKISKQLEEIIEQGFGISISWRSPAQLKKFFYSVLGLKPIKKRNANGIMTPTINREALEQLSINLLAEPFCSRLMLLRDLDKKRQFLETAVDADGRMRTNFNIAGTTTGRLASSMADFGTGTNLQNVDPELRSNFVADPGTIFLNLDLEQADSRNVGMICWNLFVESHGPEFAGSYLDACESGDLHTAVCRMAWKDLAWGNDPNNFRKIADQIFYRHYPYRFMAKKLGHGSNYYGQPPAIAKQVKVTKAIVEAFQKNYFSAFPCIKAWHEWVKAELLKCSTLTTIFDRRRVFFGRADDDRTIREAISYCPQSMTADEIDTGILKIFRERWNPANPLYHATKHIKILLQVHDAVLLQFPEQYLSEIVPWALEILQVPIELKLGRTAVVPTEAKVGWNWGDVQYNKDGSVKSNPNGLVKWKGIENRSRV